MPSMHDMIDELNDIECPSYPPVDQGCNGFGGNGNLGCGFGSWIWILLILFYAINFKVSTLQTILINIIF